MRRRPDWRLASSPVHPHQRTRRVGFPNLDVDERAPPRNRVVRRGLFGGPTSSTTSTGSLCTSNRSRSNRTALSVPATTYRRCPVSTYSGWLPPRISCLALAGFQVEDGDLRGLRWIQWGNREEDPAAFRQQRRVDVVPLTVARVRPRQHRRLAAAGRHAQQSSGRVLRREHDGPVLTPARSSRYLARTDGDGRPACNEHFLQRDAVEKPDPLAIRREKRETGRWRCLPALCVRSDRVRGRPTASLGPAR